MIKTSENKLTPFPKVALRIMAEYWLIGHRVVPDAVRTDEGWTMPAVWDVAFLKKDGKGRWGKV